MILLSLQMDSNYCKKGATIRWWRWYFQRNSLVVGWKAGRIDTRVFIRQHLEYRQVRLFFKALPDRGLVLKGKQVKDCKNSKQCFTIAFFVRQTNCYLESKSPRCFKGLKGTSRPGKIHYFANSKSWVASEIFEAVLSRLNRKLNFKNW